MSFKILLICFLLNKINSCLASEPVKVSHDRHEVQIVFAAKDFRGNTISNLSQPIKRFFEDKETALSFVKYLNLAKKNHLMLRLIKLTYTEITTLENMTFEDRDSGLFYKAGSIMLADDATIYVKQIKPT